jgi:ATP-binding cassette, subfamily C, type I secretion system permease/ATPase
MLLDEAGVVRALIAMHWLGMVLGLGMAAAADFFGLRMMLSRARGPSRRVFLWAHRLIGVALFLLLFSGGGLITLRMEAWCGLEGDSIFRFGAFCVPNKVIVKLTLITVLVGVALLIEAHLLPLSKRAQRPLLAHLAPLDVVRASVIGTASLTCWGALAMIPMVKPLQSWPVLDLLTTIALVWAALASSMFLTLCVLRLLLRGQGGALGDLLRPMAAAIGIHAVPCAAHIGASAQSSSPMGGYSPRADGEDGLPSRVTPLRPGVRLASAHPERTSRVAPPDAREEDGCERGPVTIESAIAACRRAAGGAALISLVINVLMLAGPLYMLQIYDRVLTSRSLETLTALTIMLVGLYAFLGGLDLIRARVLARLAVRLDRLLGPPLLRRAVEGNSVDAKAGPQEPLRDLEQIRQFVSGPVPAALFDLPWAPLYVVLVFLLHPLLGFVALAGTAVLVALSIANQFLTRRPSARAADDLARSHALVEAGRRNAETLKAMGMADAHRQRWLDEHRVALSRQLQAGDAASLFSIAIKIGRLLLQSLLLATGAYLALQDAMSPGAMIAASIIATRALAPIEQLIGQWRSLLGALGSVQRCRALLRAPEAAQQGLFVLAPGRTTPVLKGLDFQLEPGDALAVIGPSAAGKSTLARALVGVWPARHGDVRLDGAALGQWDPHQLGKHIGYLPQDVTLFEGTIVENIARLDRNPDPRAVLAAANAAGVHEMILRLENGYGTRVGEGGVALSGGQRQRIALARAFYGDPALIVMDEPNANLDEDGERALVAAIRRARESQRTVVVMAHRQSVLAAVNRVLVLKDGRQVAFGSPQDIVRKAHPDKATEKHHGSSAPVRLATVKR